MNREVQNEYRHYFQNATIASALLMTVLTYRQQLHNLSTSKYWYKISSTVI